MKRRRKGKVHIGALILTVLGAALALIALSAVVYLNARRQVPARD